MARLPLPDDVAAAARASLPTGAAPQPGSAVCPARPASHWAAKSDLGQAASAEPQQATFLSDGSPAGRRRYLTCCVRLSPEKEPHRFVKLVEVLARWVQGQGRGLG